jgi:hypothetical protein
MLDAYRGGEDGQTRLTLLSTWLGHAHPANTYWYLSASPELMAAAGRVALGPAGLMILVAQSRRWERTLAEW